jgi:peptidoglycan/LPS O-acetylase OafA/YrhL
MAGVGGSFVFHIFQITALPDWVPAKVTKVLMSSSTPVYLFVIISGFVITHLLLAKQQSYGPYIVRRLMRIAPVYLFCLALAIATSGCPGSSMSNFRRPSWAPRHGTRHGSSHSGTPQSPTRWLT